MNKTKCVYDYENKCDCSEDDKCGCTYEGNMAHNFSCDLENGTLSQNSADVVKSQNTKA